jgi:hypothetical protein
MPYATMRKLKYTIVKNIRKYARNFYLKILADNVTSKEINMLKIIVY